MNTEGHAGMVTEQGLQAIWGKEWAVDDVNDLQYINHPYHLFLSDNEDETGTAGNSSNQSVAFVNVQKEETVNVTVQKQWASYADENEYNTYCVTVQLFRKDIGKEDAGWELVGEEILNRAGAWKHTWYQLDENYIYSVEETEVYYYDDSGIKNVVSPQSYTTKYSTDGGETWQETSDGAAFRPNDSAGSGIIIRNTKKYYLMPETGGAGTQSYTMGGFLLLTGAAFLLLYSHTKHRKEDSASS